ncbi:MAG: NAD(P)/FAD-dependent oxidoreductase [Alphaproteobacteria bacterium]|nr:NAD(P)/FAD-dependent oxidoreductase [Alphaproteobacteria bacterium]
MSFDYDVIVIGAGAAGMMCAAEAGKRYRSVVVIDHMQTPGEKIRISGGGRCNFTNLHCSPAQFISDNPHFCKSALSRYTQQDFIKLVKQHGIAFHEKTLGQLFCDGSSQQIIDMMLAEMDNAGVLLSMETKVEALSHDGSRFQLKTSRGDLNASSVVIATGGLSIPKIGATGFGYDVAQQFGHDIIPPRAALVPLRFSPEMLAATKPLSGIAVDPSTLSHGKTTFREGMLFTHRGLSGPSVLQISSYWQEGDAVTVNLLPDTNGLLDTLKTRRKEQPRQMLHNVLSALVPRRVAEWIAADLGIDAPMADLSDKKLALVAERLQKWQVIPTGSEGYRTAEVTRGGVDTRGLSSKTMESTKQSGLYFIGEVVDVTGWLGGYNFQWAWSSGWVAGQYA